MVARLIQLTARLRAFSNSVPWITPGRVRWRTTTRGEMLVRGRKKKKKKKKRLSWRFLLKHFPQWSMLFIAHLIHICVNEVRGALQHTADTETSEAVALTAVLRLNHPLANAANEWESASRLTALILLHRLSCCSPETDQYHLLNTQEAWESIKGLLLSN